MQRNHKAQHLPKESFTPEEIDRYCNIAKARVALIPGISIHRLMECVIPGQWRHKKRRGYDYTPIGIELKQHLLDLGAFYTLPPDTTHEFERCFPYGQLPEQPKLFDPNSRHKPCKVTVDPAVKGTWNFSDELDAKRRHRAEREAHLREARVSPSKYIQSNH